MVLVSTQPLTEMSNRNLPGVKGRPAPKTDNLTAIRQPIVYKNVEPRRLTTLWASTACYRDSFFFMHKLRKVQIHPTEHSSNMAPKFSTSALFVIVNT
jgi:hypothetical protein